MRAPSRAGCSRSGRRQVASRPELFYGARPERSGARPWRRARTHHQGDLHGRPEPAHGAFSRAAPGARTARTRRASRPIARQAEHGAAQTTVKTMRRAGAYRAHRANVAAEIGEDLLDPVAVADRDAGAGREDGVTAARFAEVALSMTCRSSAPPCRGAGTAPARRSAATSPVKLEPTMRPSSRSASGSTLNPSPVAIPRARRGG